MKVVSTKAAEGRAMTFNSAYLETKIAIARIDNVAGARYDIAFSGSEVHIIILQYHGVIRSEILCVRPKFFIARSAYACFTYVT